MEIFLDSGSDGLAWSGVNDYQIIISPVADSNTLRIKEFFHQIPAEKIQSQFRRGSGRRNSTYEIILGIPKFDFHLNSGEIGFSVAAHNLDTIGKSDAKFNWFFLEPGIHLGSLKFEGTDEK